MGPCVGSGVGSRAFGVGSGIRTYSRSLASNIDDVKQIVAPCFNAQVYAARISVVIPAACAQHSKSNRGHCKAQERQLLQFLGFFFKHLENNDHGSANDCHPNHVLVTAELGFE